MTTTNARVVEQRELDAAFLNSENFVAARLDSRPIGQGGAGDVFRATVDNAPGIGGPSQWAAKLYHPGQADKSQYEKLWHLIHHPVTV